MHKFQNKLTMNQVCNISDTLVKYNFCVRSLDKILSNI